MIDLHSFGSVFDLMGIAFLIMLTPLVFILIDLGAGVHKAKIRGESISSKGFRETVRKIARYYNVLFVLMALDFMQLLCLWYMHKVGVFEWIMFPWLTLLGAIGIGLIEVKSVLEPADEKESRRTKELMSLARSIAAHKTEPAEIAEAVLKYLNKSKDENNEEKL